MRWNETEEKLALESQIFRDAQLFKILLHVLASNL